MAKSIYRFDESHYNTRLENVSWAGRCVFTGCCATREFDFYKRYSFSSGIGNPDVLLRVQHELWDQTLQKKLGGELRSLQEDCENLIVRFDSKGNQDLPSYQESAIISTVHWIACVSVGNIGDPIAAASEGFNTVWHAVAYALRLETDHPQYLETIDSHELVQQELLRQDRDLAEIEEFENLAKDNYRALVMSLRARAEAESMTFPGTSE